MSVLARVLLGALAMAPLARPAWGEPSAAPAAADAAAPESFDAAFFAAYSPNTAMDMLAHVPGFAVEDGGGAAANVLVDGQRPARSQPLNALLSRIPAAQVQRVEILRGAKAAAAVPGRTTVANIVRSASAGDGLWNAGVEVAHGVVSPRGSLTWNGRTGRIEYSVGATYEDHDRPQTGEGFKVDGDGPLISTERDTGRREQHQRGLTAQISTPVGDGGRLSLNGQSTERSSDEVTDTLSHDPAATPSEQEHRTGDDSERDYQLGASLEHDLGAWSADVDGVWSRERSRTGETQAQDELLSDGFYDEDKAISRDADGALLRGVFSRPLSETQRLELGVEAGEENIDAHRDFAQSGLGWSNAINADVLIEQDHVQLYATHLWRFAPHWSAETRIAREEAGLRFVEEAEQQIDTSYWKGSFQLAREFGRRNQIRARISRDVGHVDIDDLIIALADNPTPAGIPELQPDMNWRAELKTDLRFGRRGSLGVAVSQTWVERTLDRIVVNGPNGPFDAPGNIGDGEISALNVNLSTAVPLIPDASFSMSAGTANSSVIDPVTGLTRSMRGVADRQVWAEFRQEVPAHAFSWGFSYYQQSPSFWLTRNEIGSWDGGPSVDAFLETTALKGVKARFRASSILDRPARIEQLDYTPDRAGALDTFQHSYRYSGTTFSVSLAGSF